MPFAPPETGAKGIEPLIADIIRCFKTQPFVGTEPYRKDIPVEDI